MTKSNGNADGLESRSVACRLNLQACSGEPTVFGSLSLPCPLDRGCCNPDLEYLDASVHVSRLSFVLLVAKQFAAAGVKSLSLNQQELGDHLADRCGVFALQPASTCELFLFNAALDYFARTTRSQPVGYDSAA